MSDSRTNEQLRFAVLAGDVACFRIINQRLHVLIGKVVSPSIHTGEWALIGGLLREDETADQAIDRLLLKKAGIQHIYKEQLYTFSTIDRDPRGRVVSVAYIALAGTDPQDLEKAGVETRWVPTNEIPHLAYDHDMVVAYALERLKSKINWSSIIQFLLPEKFTLGELQKAHEVVAGKGLDKRNFRKKMMSMDILKDSGQVKKEGIMRPAALYTFKSKKLQYFELL